MKDYPFIKCLHPKRIRNPYTNEVLIVSCGECDACNLHKSDVRTLKCELESKSHEYCMFVTLTYSWDNIPICNVFKNDDGSYRVMDNTPRFSKYKDLYRQRLGDVFSSEKDLNSLRLKVNHPNGMSFPYLCKKDLQLFVKRFRKHSLKYSDEKIRYYGCGEYGPVHFRPHYHLLLWFSDQNIFINFAKILCSAWSLGRVDYSLSRGSCAKYVSSYVNGSCYLPLLYKISQTRPFSVHSTFLGEEVLLRPMSEIYEELDQTKILESQSCDYTRTSRYESIIKRCINLDGSYTELALWRSLKTKIFPRCRGYYNISSSERLFSYRTYEIAAEFTGEYSPYRQAKYIVQYMYEHWMDYYTEKDKNDSYVHHYIPIYDKLLVHFMQGMRFSTKKVCRSDKDAFEQMFHSIVAELYVSRQFIHNAKELNLEYCSLLKKIEKFYYYEEYYNLKNSLSNQAKLIESDLSYVIDEDFDSLPYFYNNVSYDFNEFNNTKLPRMFLTDTVRRSYFGVKHKELNDLNYIFDNK